MVFISLIAIVPITAAYWILPDAVSAPPGQANTETTLMGAVLVYGTLLALILLTTLLFFMVYYETKLSKVINMILGMGVVTIAAVIGGFSDINIGDIARFLDVVGYIGVLIGIVLIYTGFTGTTEPKTTSP